jgi:hypothetical protein
MEHYMPKLTNTASIQAWLRSTGGRKACQQGLAPYRIIFDPYHLPDGRPLCQSADFYPNERDKRIVMAESEDAAAMRFAHEFNRAIKSIQKVTV